MEEEQEKGFNLLRSATRGRLPKSGIVRMSQSYRVGTCLGNVQSPRLHRLFVLPSGDNPLRNIFEYVCDTIARLRRGEEQFRTQL